MNNAPLLQRVLKLTGFALAGALILGALLDSLSSAITLLSLRTAVFITSIVVPGWLLAELIAAFFGIRWWNSAATRSRIRSLGPRIRFGILGMLALLWVSQISKLLPSVEGIPILQAELHNVTDKDISVATRGEFVLWLPTAMYDGAPRIGGRLSIYPLTSSEYTAAEFVVSSHSSVRCSVEFLNPSMFLHILDGADTDASLWVRTSAGLQISPTFAFSRGVVGNEYLEWTLRELTMPTNPQN